jgi:hypothetical protein
MDEFAERRFVKVMRGAASHRKFRRMGRQLDISRFEALGLTVALWEWTDARRPLGSLGQNFTAEDLTDSIGVEHIDPDDLVKAWIDVGLIDEDDDGYHVHGWMDAGRTGGSAQARSEKAREAAHKRWHPDRPFDECSECNPDTSEHAPSHDDAATDASGHAPSDAEGYQGARSEVPDEDAYAYAYAYVDAYVDVEPEALKDEDSSRALDAQYVSDEAERIHNERPFE